MTLLVLAIEGILIFRPAVRQIKQVVTRLEQTGANLAAAKKQAEAASEAKTRFLANVSHELRTPMTAVLGMTELAKETSDPGTRAQYLSIVEQSGQSLLRLLNDLIDTARIEVSEPEITDSVFSPLAISHQVVELLRPSAVSKGLDFEFSHNEVADCFAHGDSLRLTQVLTNLVGNAIKYTDAGFVRAALDVHSEDDRCRLQWTISDSGIGVSKEDQSKLFEPFFQANSAAETTRGGAGLGLSICQQIVKAMGGSITLTSALTQGTTVSVDLDLPRASADVSRPTEEPSLPYRAPACLDVLVVEDSPVLQWMLKDWLQSAGHRVSVASDGDEAIAFYQTYGADLIVTDYRLGAINGAETARRIRTIAETNLRPDPSILCLTGDAGVTPSLPGDKVFDAVAMKPIRRNAFFQLIENVLGAKSPMPASKVDDDASDFRQELGVELARILPKQLTDLHHALKTQNFHTARLLAHRLRGQVAYFDQPDTERLLLHLERASESTDESAAAEAYEEAQRLLNDLVQSFSLHSAAPLMAYNQ